MYALALLGLVASAAAQGVTSIIAPPASAPAGCSASYDGQFEITVVNATSVMKRGLLEPRQATNCGQEGILTLNIKDGILRDAGGRIGYIASNFQFQFDGPPPQAGAIFTAGFSLCSNGSLALGGSSIFYECQSGNFFNLYDRHWAAQCTPVFIDIIPCAGSGAISSSSVATQSPKTTATASPATTTAQATVISEFTDGQPQVPTTAPPVSEFTDGQPQATTPAVVTQITDGQPQVPTGTQPAPVPAGAPAVGAGSQAVLALAGVVAAALL